MPFATRPLIDRFLGAIAREQTDGYRPFVPIPAALVGREEALPVTACPYRGGILLDRGLDCGWCTADQRLIAITNPTVTATVPLDDRAEPPRRLSADALGLVYREYGASPYWWPAAGRTARLR